MMTEEGVVNRTTGSKKAYVTRVEIPKNLEQKCLEAAKKCPNKAIIIISD